MELVGGLSQQAGKSDTEKGSLAAWNQMPGNSV